MATEPHASPGAPDPRRPAQGQQPAQGQPGQPAQGQPSVQGQQPPAQGQPGSPAGTGKAQPPHKVKRTRISGTWVAIVCFAVVLVLLLLFIVQNSNEVDISFFGAHARTEIGIALLFSAVLGILLVAIAATARILQLRAVAKRHRQADADRLAQARAANPDAGSGPAR